LNYTRIDTQEEKHGIWHNIFIQVNSYILPIIIQKYLL